MKQKAYSTLALIASNLSKGNYSPGQTDSGIAICELMSREFGTELTIAEGGIVADFLQIIEQDKQPKKQENSIEVRK